MILAFITECCRQIKNTDIIILEFDLCGSANICLHWNIMCSASPLSVSLKGWDMLQMPSTRLLLIKICYKLLTWRNRKVLIYVASRRYTLSAVVVVAELCWVRWQFDTQEWWLTSWLVAQCADVLVTTNLAMWY